MAAFVPGPSPFHCQGGICVSQHCLCNTPLECKQKIRAENPLAPDSWTSLDFHCRCCISKAYEWIISQLSKQFVNYLLLLPCFWPCKGFLFLLLLLPLCLFLLDFPSFHSSPLSVLSLPVPFHLWARGLCAFPAISEFYRVCKRTFSSCCSSLSVRVVCLGVHVRNDNALALHLWAAAEHGDKSGIISLYCSGLKHLLSQSKHFYLDKHISRVCVCFSYVASVSQTLTSLLLGVSTHLLHLPSFSLWRMDCSWVVECEVPEAQSRANWAPAFRGEFFSPLLKVLL